MVEKAETTAGDVAAGDLRGTLVRRLAVAGVLVAVLLGVLAFFDHLATQPDEAEAPVFTQAVPVAPRKEVSQPVTPADSAEPAGETPAAEPAEAPPPPVAEVTLPPAPEAPKPVASVPALSSRPAARRPAISEETAPPQIQPAARDVEAPPAAAVPPAAPRLFAGFLLQAGVFTSVQRAEELHAKLTLSGVPSTLETRVQVGPFRTRQEAEAARAKLKELGINTILVAPAARR